VLSAVATLCEQSRFHFLFVHRNGHGDLPRESLIGFFPFVEGRGPLGLAEWRLWQHPYCYLTSPLIRDGLESVVLDAVLQDVAALPRGPQFISLPLCPGEGRFHQACIDVTRRRLLSSFALDEYVRAALSVPSDSETYLKETLSGHHLREYRRLRRKLEEQGQVEYRSWKSRTPPDSWIDAFLDLEADGWKAQSQTAIRCNPRHVEYFKRLLTRFAEVDRLLIDGLFLDGQPIAMGCMLLASPAAYAFKVAFDESRAKYSPGVQLELERLRRGTLPESIHFVDSCAVPDHPMINRIWRERRTVRNLVISTGRTAGDLAIGLLPLRRSLNRLFRRRGNSLRLS